MGIPATARTSRALLAIIAACLLASFGCAKESEKAIPKRMDATTNPQGYVGSERCGSCHARNYYTWRGTTHANMLCEPSKKTVVGNFFSTSSPIASDIYGELSSAGIQMSVKDGIHHVVAPNGESGTKDYSVDFALGGTLRQMYLAADASGRLRVLPVQWNIREGRWTMAGGDTGPMPGNKLRDWLTECAGCHVTGLVDTDQKEARDAWAENGIGCEACHGPGARHANAKNPEKPDTIFNPGNFHDAMRADMVCGRCHTRGISSDGVHFYPAGYEHGMDYRAIFREESRANDKFFWPDGSSRTNHQQFIDFRESKMFAAGVKCWACHNPHKSSANGGADLRLSGNALCRSCHIQEGGPRNLTHAIHDNGNCLACHMPPTAKSSTAGDISSHTFLPIPPAATIRLGEGDVAKQPNSCNLCHYHQKRPVKDLDAVLQDRVKTFYQHLGDKAGR